VCDVIQRDKKQDTKTALPFRSQTGHVSVCVLVERMFYVSVLYVMVEKNPLLLVLKHVLPFAPRIVISLIVCDQLQPLYFLIICLLASEMKWPVTDESSSSAISVHQVLTGAYEFFFGPTALHSSARMDVVLFPPQNLTVSSHT
jgi:hypothetical protein